MPELPEVETVARGLQSTVAGRRILRVTLGKTDFIDNPEDVIRELPGTEIRVVERFGKFLLLRLRREAAAPGPDNEAALLVHLGMTGMLSPWAAAQPHAKHTHALMALDDGRELRYVDPRRFGRIAYLPPEVLREELKRFGADPLLVGPDEFAERIHSRTSHIKALLLDQSVLRGVGNIYADESLWRAKIHPQRVGSSLAPKELKALYRGLQAILHRAIQMRGSSISNFVDAEGLPGEYQAHHKAYGREGRPCLRCKTPIRRIIVAGRSSFFCPTCQPAPRKRRKKRRSTKKKKARRRV